jgi:hypothetical protein
VTLRTRAALLRASFAPLTPILRVTPFLPLTPVVEPLERRRLVPEAPDIQPTLPREQFDVLQ